jgi:hypothetical protein
MTLGIKLSKGMVEGTLRKTAGVGLANAKANLPHIKKTILDLRRGPGASRPSSVVVVGGGPSLHRKNPALALLESGYQGEIVASDAALGYCLRNGLVPHYVVTVDPHPHRIIRWFGDPFIESRPADDYYTRQDIDPIHRENEARANELLLQLVNKQGESIKAIIATSSDPGITRRCLEAGMELYWWNPLYDDYEEPGSYSRRVYELTGVPCMVTGGNVGASSFVFANAILDAEEVALVGFDFGYAPGTPPFNTQSYYELVDLLGDRIAEAFIDIWNPYTGETWISDPTHYWYRQIFLEIASVAGCRTFNCTEGGTLFGERVEFVTLKEFLERERGGRTRVTSV